MKNIVVTLALTEDLKEQFQKDCAVPVQFIEKSQLTAEHLQSAHAVIGNVPIPLLQQAPHLEWVQLESAGADGYFTDLDLSISLTNSTGAYGHAISEYMLTGILYFYKKFDCYHEFHQQKLWQHAGSVQTLEKKSVCFVGYGDIATALAKRLQAFNCKITAVKRTEAAVPYADTVVTTTDLDKVLPTADIIINTLPLSPQTDQLFDEKRLRQCKKDALLINVGRGRTIDTKALMKVLEDGYFSGVLLDVVDPEPLPADHPLWDCERLLITPHCSGGFALIDTLHYIMKIATDNITRFVDGQPLKNNVDRTTGYKVSNT